MSKWYSRQCATDQAVVVSSRIRLARNLKSFNFPNRIEKDEGEKLIAMVNEALLVANDNMRDIFDIINMKERSQLEKIALMEHHCISPRFLNMTCPTALLLAKDESVSIMVNEEDHLRIQTMACGMDLSTAMKHANEIDDLLEEKLEYAYHQQYGYLTTCPTNVGTGLRASYMVHVPALETTGQLQSILDAIGKFGLTVRGIYGEGSEAQGSFYQISNQVTLGMTEQETIDNLTAVTRQIMEQELNLRTRLLDERRLQFEDAVFRSYGILKNARMLSVKEAMTLLSDVKLGFELGILNPEGDYHFNSFELMTTIQPANLQVINSRTMSIEERDVARANYMRQQMPELQ